jgi:uncharacterized protein (TIGR03435 family)
MMQPRLLRPAVRPLVTFLFRRRPAILHHAGMLRLATSYVLLAIAAFCQTPTFELASVKPAAPVTGHFQYHMTLNIDGPRVEIINGSLIDLVHTAFRVNSYQVQGPEWMASQKFDVQARMPAGVSKEQVPEMLQALLAERFGLKVHHATSERMAFALVPGKGELKLKESPTGADGSGWSRAMGPEGQMHIETKAMTMPALVELIARFLDYPVVDATGLHGQYDVPLDFTADDLRNGEKWAGVRVEDDPGLPAGGTGLYSSVARLGLKLAPRKLPIEMIVVDRLEKNATAN